MSTGVCAWFEKAGRLLKAQHWFRPMEHLKPLSSTLAGARTESLGKLKEEQLKVGPNGGAASGTMQVNERPKVGPDGKTRGNERVK